MRVIPASYDILRFDPEHDVDIIAQGYAICYKTKIPNSYEEKCVYISRRRNHESPLEHSIMSVKFIVNRGISHELVRHRHTGYSQESTRYCSYIQEKFGSEVTFIEDSHVIGSPQLLDIWMKGRQADEDEYFARLNIGQTPDEARGCLPNDLKTEIIMTTNLREWRSIFKLRTSKRAHYQMREVMCPLLDDVKKQLPCVFDDIEY